MNTPNRGFPVDRHCRKMRQIRESGDKISKVANLNGANLFQMPGVRSARKGLVLMYNTQ